MNVSRKLIIGAAGLLMLAGVGGGVAMAQTAPNPSTTTAPGASPTSPTNSDTNPVQQGDQHANDQADHQDKQDSRGEQVGPSDQAGSPGAAEGNHEDANGANVDHTPPGEQPEPASSGAEG